VSPRRLRLDRLDHEAAPDGRCILTAHLSSGDREVEAAADGVETHQGRIRATAQAALEAAALAVPDGPELHLVGVKGIRAFDGWVVIIRVNAVEDGSSHRLLGASSAESEDDVLQATARAALDATNRLLEKYLDD